MSDSELTIEQKCREIVESLVRICDDIDKETMVSFSPDWGFPSLTLWTREEHCHIGNPECSDGTFEDTVDRLHWVLKGMLEASNDG